MLFLEKSRKLEEYHKIESEMNKIYQSLEQKLNDLDPEQRSEYDILREENQKYMSNVQDLRDEVSRINADIIEGENLLKNNQQKKEVHRLKDQINQLLRRKDELELQTNEVNNINLIYHINNINLIILINHINNVNLISLDSV